MNKTIFDVKTDFEQQLIKLISQNNESKSIRFWREEERISEQEILNTYADIYSVSVNFNYSSAAKPTFYCYTKFMVNNIICTNTIRARMSEKDIKSLRAWAKNAGHIVAKYINNKYCLYLKKITFFLLPEERTFVIPNIYIENMDITEDFKGKHILLTENFSKYLYEEYEASLDWWNKRLSSISIVK